MGSECAGMGLERTEFAGMGPERTECAGMAQNGTNGLGTVETAGMSRKWARKAQE